MASRVKRTKVGRACGRCRRQKLRCDIQRPCTLCLRAGVECQAGDLDQFIPSDPKRHTNKRKRRGSTRERASRRNGPSGDQRLGGESWSSSTLSLVTGAFQFHNSTPNTSMTAFPGGITSGSLPERRSTRSGISIPWMKGSRSLIAEMIKLLPSREVASLLIDTYFDRVHWFILIFHQDDFRQEWQQLYALSTKDLLEKYHNPGFISTFLVVISIGLHYAGSYRHGILQAHDVDPVALKETIFSAIRARLLDIVSFGSLESVQTCVLLGTYYLYHGNPDLAWPVCGCGLRVAQALNLHRKMPTSNIYAQYRESETRKRCWWAIYEIETFCSMSYGYPHGINDADCDVELLDPLATSSGQSPATFDEIHQCPASLLSYKYLMSKLSVLVKDILTDLYGISHQSNGQKDKSGSHNLQSLICKISKLDDRLRQWKKDIPSALHPSTDITSYSSAEEMDHDIGASGPKFEKHIYQLQALSLELTYENARILLHRPLLSYKLINQPDTQATGLSSTPLSLNPLQLSSAACRDAALHTSNLGDSPIFNLAADTYAAAFIGIHTFTAGVMLCILTSIEPLSPQAHESKMGLSRLMRMQTHLKSRTQSTLAAQGLEIIERLTRLVMEKELKEILNDKSGSDCRTQRVQDQSHEDATQPQSSATNDLPEVQKEGIFDFIEDPAMSQALFDFDQVISGNDISVPLEPLFPDLAGLGNGFTQEQAWIWGMDSSQFPRFD